MNRHGTQGPGTRAADPELRSGLPIHSERRQTAPSGSFRSPAGGIADDRMAVTLTVGELRQLVTDAALAAVAGRNAAPLLVDKQDMAHQLGCSPAHIDHLRKRGMPWVPVGQVVRFEPARVLEWLREQKGAD